MSFLLIKLFTLRLMVVVSFCLLLCNCGNKSALFLDSSESVKKTITEKQVNPESDKKLSDEDSSSDGEQTP